MKMCNTRACEMRGQREQTALTVLVFILILPLRAQDYDSDSVRGLRSNAGFVVTAPLSQTARYTSVGGGIVYGVGYNFSQHHSAVAEVMWSSLPTTDAASTRGHRNLVTLTANYRLDFEGKVCGPYIIGGGGLTTQMQIFLVPVRPCREEISALDSPSEFRILIAGFTLNLAIITLPQKSATCK